MRQEHRCVFFVHNGPGPYVCFFCGNDVVFHKVLVHHEDHDHENNDPTNLKPTHAKCHTAHHREHERDWRGKISAGHLRRVQTDRSASARLGWATRRGKLEA